MMSGRGTIKTTFALNRLRIYLLANVDVVHMHPSKLLSDLRLHYGIDIYLGLRHLLYKVVPSLVVILPLKFIFLGKTTWISNDNYLRKRTQIRVCLTSHIWN